MQAFGVYQRSRRLSDEASGPPAGAMKRMPTTTITTPKSAPYLAGPITAAGEVAERSARGCGVPQRERLEVTEQDEEGLRAHIQGMRRGRATVEALQPDTWRTMRQAFAQQPR